MKGFSESLQRWGRKPAADIERAADQLITEAKAAAKLRAFSRDPDVSALTVERTRERVEQVLLIAMTCGLLYTTVNVQSFVSGGSVGLAWWAAWLVEPFITAGVLSLLRIEQVARRNGVVPGGWVRFTRWAAFIVTYVMNTWAAWLSWVPSEIFKHSAIPVLVFFFAEALTDGRDALTKAAELVAERTRTEREPVEDPTLPLAPTPVEDAVTKAYVDEIFRGQEWSPEVPAVEDPPPRGHMKRVLIPAAYRRLADQTLAQGGSLDDISGRQVDREAGTNNYCTGVMIKVLRTEYEQGRGVRVNGAEVG